MNEAEMKLIIPPTVGILVAGIASGICFLLIGSFRKGKGGKNVDDSRCACCLKPFLVGRGVECNDCGSRSCRKACCRWDSVDNSWFCLFCYHSRSWSRRKEKWFETFGGLPVEPETSKNFSTAKSRVYDEGAEDVAIHSELDLAAGGCKEGDSMETVREFVEKIVSVLVGNVDDTSIDRLYDHPAYDRLFEAYGAPLASALTRLAISLSRCIDNKPATDTPTMAHTALRDLVERAVDEARKLPGLGATVSTGIQEDSSFPDQNYEELLATAILNKVIEKFQNERVDGNSNVLHGRPRSKHTNHENEIGLDEGVEEGSSSLEPLSQDECSSEGSGSRSRHIRPRQEPLSLTIEEQIEEVTTTYTSDDEIRGSKADVLDFRNARRVPFPEFGMDIVDPSQDSSEESQEEASDSAPVDVITPVETWEENWLFQKRKIQTQSEPVSMLVPNPSADFRALIGDKDAEDTSDLSEFSAQSDDDTDDDDEDDLAEAINGVVPKSSTIKKIDPDFSLYFRDIGKIDESSKRISNAENPECGVFVATVIENGERRTLTPDKTVGDYRNQEKSDRRDERSIKLANKSCLNDDSGSSGNRLETENEILKENSEVPKTPASSPMRQSLSESAPEAPAGCDIWQLKEKLVSIDKTADAVDNNREAISSSTDKIAQEDKSEEKEFVPSSPVNRYGESPTMNGCRKAVPHVEEVDRPKDKSTDQCDGASQDIAAISSQEEGRKIENGTAYEQTERRCQALAEANADSASEKQSSGNPITNDDIELAAPPRPGTIAEREHKKWENAAPIENNPYSEENIQKRLLERQYARRSSDVSGNSPKLQTSPSPPLQIVLGAGRPDFKRFGRDYYINEAKFPKGHSVGDNGFYTATSRPNSSLSQHSLSTGSDYEQQEMSRSIETASTCSSSSESRTKAVSDLQRNNVQAALRRGSMPTDKEYETEIKTRIYRNDERRQSLNDVSREKSWNGGDWSDDILESERKNSKNEINAKLNNREHFDENNKPIRRIDLRAYGFENEFNVRNDEVEEYSRRPARVVNKLDLRTFGYDSGLRRTQSNNSIDRRTSKTPHGRPNVRNSIGKSNFVEDNDDRRVSELPSFEAASGDGIFTKSTEILNDDARIECKTFGSLTAAKSVPNIGDLYSRIGDGVQEMNYEEGIVEDSDDSKTTDPIKENRRNDYYTNSKNAEIIEKNGRKDTFVAEESSMPSVRRLAQAFSKTERTNPLPSRKPPKSVSQSSKDRPTTPEIHIVDTPRQMHSLTARSLSREFREGLRQMSTKDTAPSRVKTIEQNRLLQVPSPTNPGGSSEDVSVISPGKLKNNIQFWEQLHRKS